MRLLHTADLHLGRMFFGTRLTGDQAHILDQMVEIARDQQVDAVLLAGDVYDRAVPPPEAVELLDDFLSRLVRGLKIPVAMIAGNHDGPERLGFAARLLEQGGLHVGGTLAGTPRPLLLEDRHGTVAVHLLPYAEPASARQFYGDAGLVSHELAMAAQMAAARSAQPDGARMVVVAHAFVAGSACGSSERPLSVGGSEQVGADVFTGAHYTALGHLHRAQSLGGGALRYSGAPLKYAFDEADGAKSVTVVELDGHGRAEASAIPLSPRRDLRVVEGRLAELLAAAEGDPRRDDYLLVRLTDPTPVLDAMARLRAAYGNVLSIERTGLGFNPAAGLAAAAQVEARTPLALFEDFFAEVTGEPLAEDDRAEVAGVLETLAEG